MSENEASNIDLIKQIPDCEISWDEFSDARFEGGTMSLHSVYPDYSRPDDQGAGADFENWHEQHSWVPLSNIRGNPYFARTLHH